MDWMISCSQYQYQYGQQVLVVKYEGAWNEVGLILSPGEVGERGRWVVLGLGPSRGRIWCQLWPNIALCKYRVTRLKLSQIRWEDLVGWKVDKNAHFPPERCTFGILKKRRQKCVRIFQVAFVTGHKFLCLLAKQLSHYFSSTFIILVPAVNHHLCFAVLLRVVFRKWQNRPSLSSPFAARVEDTKQFDTKPSLSTSLPVSVLELRRWNIFLVQNHLFHSQVPRLLACHLHDVSPK